MPLSSVRVATQPGYDVRIGPGALSESAELAAAFPSVALLADRRAFVLHGERLGELTRVPRLELPGGEATKSLARLAEVLEFLADASLDRRSALVTFGGGVIGDLGGLAASLFKRGIALVHLPTTLLAQVDASVGGKTGVNLESGKNLAGTFHQPRAVLADTEVLATLDERELRSGAGEVLKTALVGGETPLRRLEARASGLVARGDQPTAEIVTDCVRIKAARVAADPGERDARRALNLGHTFAHAIEHAAGYGRVPHGLAVACGVSLAFETARRLELLEDLELPERAARVAKTLGLPRDLDELRAACGDPLPAARLVAAMAHDKKGAVGAPELVLLRAAGEPVCGVRVPIGLLERVLR